ncbi:ribokinase [Paenochrobactrum pullorum]|uniref:ribokinase n=1 Tax=Paenochrobactrum pullorum TaxID=1324351 RepID=UPI0035BC0464
MIITFGSINVDFMFQLTEMPRAGQTLLANDFHTEAGGKGGNQALAAARDGAEVLMYGAVGTDALAQIGLSNLEKFANISRVERLAAPTGCASVYTDSHGNNMIAVASGANLHASSAVIEDAYLKNANIVLMQMENKPEEVEKLIRRTNATKALAILNLAPAYRLPEDVLSLCGLIVVNEDEAEALGQWLDCPPDAKSLSTHLNTGILRTLGGEGAEAFMDGQLIQMKTVAVDVKDTTGAGDCFVGVLASALDKGLKLGAAMERASVAAAIACTRRGSQQTIPRAQETDQFIANHMA